MISLLKYLLPVIFAATFWCGAGHSADVVEEYFMGSSITASVSQTAISASDQELCLPRQVSFANTVRLIGNARRTGSIQRSSLEFAKSGKVINAGVRYFTQNISIIIHSAMIKPSCRLKCLGRLII